MHKLCVVLASLLLLLGGAACGGGSEGGSSTDDSGSVDAEAPEAEDPNAEEAPDGSGGDAVAVELPGLPIGGPTAVLSSTLECVDVGWTEPPVLPDWIGITVTGVTFTPAEAFTQSSKTCPGGAPACLGGAFQLTGDTRCYVAVDIQGGPDVEGEMSFSSGVINCPPDRVEECEEFRDAVEREGPEPIDLPSASSAGFGTDEGTTDEGTTDEGTSDEGTSDETEESTPDSTDDGGG